MNWNTVKWATSIIGGRDLKKERLCDVKMTPECYLQIFPAYIKRSLKELRGIFLFGIWFQTGHLEMDFREVEIYWAFRISDLELEFHALCLCRHRCTDDVLEEQNAGLWSMSWCNFSGQRRDAFKTTCTHIYRHTQTHMHTRTDRQTSASWMNEV